MRSSRDLKTLTTQPRRCRSHTIIAKNLTGFQQVEVSAKSLILRMRVVLTRDRRNQTIYAADDDYIYASERKNGTQPRLGSMISTDYIRPAAIKAKVIDASCPRFGLYNMRHGLATFLAERGTDVKVIQRMLRWSSARMLQRYFHPRKQARKEQGAYFGKMGKRVQVRVQRKSPSKRWGA
jgi:integrase